jgi:4'-phosphopantetheinyl transferase
VDVAQPKSLQAPRGDEVHVLWVQTAAADDIDIGVLSAAERRRATTFHQLADRNRFLVGATTVRLSAAAAAGDVSAAPSIEVDRRCRQCQGDHGPPLIAGPLRVSVTHSGEWVGVACRLNGPVGLDIESTGTDLSSEGLMAGFLSPQEQCAPEDFLTRWTRKEAVLKAAGLGLNAAPTEVFIVEGPDGPRVQSFDRWPTPQWWHLHHLTGPPGTVSTLATWGQGPSKVREFRLDLA